MARIDWREALVRSWRLVEGLGGRPTIIATIEIARRAGAVFNDKEARALLRPFAEKFTQMLPRCYPGSTQQNKHVYPDATQALPRFHPANAGANKELLVTKITSNPESANALSGPSPGPKRVRPTVEHVEFPDEDERRVGQCLRFVAEENKSGTLSPGRVLALRAEMHAELTSLGAERWRYGLEEANNRGKAWAYARAVMRKTIDVPAPIANAPPRWESTRRQPYANRLPSAEKMAQYAALATEINTDAV